MTDDPRSVESAGDPSSTVKDSNRGPLIIGGAIVLAAIIIVIALVLLRSDEDESEADAQASGHVINGTFSISDSDSVVFYAGTCGGTGGYGDIDSGTTVTVKDQDGSIIGSSALERGRKRGAYTCSFPFAIKGLPKAGFYAIEVGGRGSVSFSRAELEQNDWKVQLSL